MKRLFAALFAALLAALLLTLSAGAASAHFSVPGGYNENDYLKLVSFFEACDQNGTKNGQKLNPAYSPHDPETWCVPASSEADEAVKLPSVLWSEADGEKRLARLELPFMRDMCGRLDLSGCGELKYLCFRDNLISELELSGCGELITLICYRNRLTSLDTSPCPKLEVLAFQENAVSQIDVSVNPKLKTLCCCGNGIASLELSHNPELTELRCERNALTALELSHNSRLNWLWCEGNPLTALNLSAAPALGLAAVRSGGNGTVGCSINEFSSSVCAVPADGGEFFGWFDANGTKLSDEPEYRPAGEAELTARFSGSPERTCKAFPAVPVLIGFAALCAAGAVLFGLMRKRKKSDKA